MRRSLKIYLSKKEPWHFNIKFEIRNSKLETNPKYEFPNLPNLTDYGEELFS
jgi:hypothetical protein